MPLASFVEDCSQIMPSAIKQNRTPRLNMESASPSTGTAYSYLPTPDGSVEGLGIVCGPVAILPQHDSAIDVAYDNSAWQAQIDSQILQFQQAYEQKLHQNSHVEAPFGIFNSFQACTTEPMNGAVNVGNEATHQISETSSAEINDSQMPSTIAFNPCAPALQTLESFPSYPMATEHDDDLKYSFQPYHLSQQLASPYFRTQSSDHRNSVSYDPQTLAPTLTTPYLQPAADIHDSFSRRPSVSSNAPSSVFSNDCQDTPYFLTPCTTPHFASTVSMEVPYTPMSTISSPTYPNHSRSLSSTSLKVPTPTYRPIRPAPYTLDAAQRQRWSTGKTMSLPSRRTQPPNFSYPSGHMRALSEQNINGMYFEDDFANGNRKSFNQNLEIIRQGLPSVVPHIEQDETQTSEIKTEEASPSSQRPVLATIQPKIPNPISMLSPPTIPPLNLPERLSRPTSPSSEDLLSSNGPALKVKSVSPPDVYTPKYKRGTKGHIEGFCGLCKPGRWYNMKNSAYWYDKNYAHGINPKTKRPHELPVERRWKIGSSQIREGLCGLCNEWIAMDSCQMSWKCWWKHAYECYKANVLCHAKIEDFQYGGEDDSQATGKDELHKPSDSNALLNQYTQQMDSTQNTWPYTSNQASYQTNGVPSFFLG